MENERVKIKDNRTKPKKSFKVLGIMFMILQLLAMATLMYSIYLINGIETKLRYIGIVIIFVVNIVSILLLRKLIKKNTIKKFFIFVVITSLLVFRLVR